jgi:putative flippase GtrA
MSLALLYAFIAVFATATNIGAQYLATLLYSGPLAREASIFLGTGVGLVVKYLCDKRWIFRFNPRDLLHDAHTFVLYAASGIGTTLLFWACEFGFDAAFGTLAMRYVGALIGLALGYWAKYHLDKRFVFRVQAT